MMMLVMVLIGKEAIFITKNALVSIYLFPNIQQDLDLCNHPGSKHSGFAKAMEE